MTPAKRPRVRRRLPSAGVRLLGEKCYFCERRFDGSFHGRPTNEHLTPVSRGGINRPPNVVLACARCNNEKGNLTEAEYRAWLAMDPRPRLAGYKQGMIMAAAYREDAADQTPSPASCAGGCDRREG